VTPVPDSVTGTIATRLARRAVQARATPLPDAAHAWALDAVTDWYGAALAGSAGTPAALLRRALGGGPAPRARRGPLHSAVGTDGSAAATAALINATAAHTEEVDDIYSPGLYHPGAPTIAAALAAAEHRGASGAQLVRAVVTGYEVGDRIAEAVNPAHYRYWHTTGTVGCLGAAAAAAEVLHAGAEEFAHALAVAATMASGLQQTFRSEAMGKPLHSGHAAHTGVLAALSAHAGFTGALDVLEGPAGFAYAMGEGAEWAAACEEFGPAYRIERTTFKPYPCCGHTFAPIDAALELRGRGADAGAGAARVRVSSYATALTVAGNPDPRTAFEAKFSIPFTVACALLYGRVRPDSFGETMLADPAVRELMRRVELHADESFTAAFPARRGARVEVRDAEGITHEAVIPDRRGDPGNPLTREQLREKFLSLAAPVISDRPAADLHEKLGRLQDLADVRSLANPSSPGAPGGVDGLPGTPWDC
jgi:2-methylcitrate dehydratase PrpD